MLSDVVDCLLCPLCGDLLSLDERALACPNRHSFDVARQGYVNLLPAGAHAGTADTSAMVQARDEFLGAGHYASLAEMLAERSAAAVKDSHTERGLVVDVGGGTGSYLRTVLERLGGPLGLVLDTSKYALRRAARAHPRVGAVAWDVWRPLPVRDACASLVVDVCAPRNGAEFARILRPEGALLLVTPTPRHLTELVENLGLVSVDERKDERLSDSLGEHFEQAGREDHEFTLDLDRGAVEALVGMGPSARHVDPGELRQRIAQLGQPTAVTASFALTTYRPCRLS